MASPNVDQPVTTDSDRPDSSTALQTPQIQQPELQPVAQPSEIRFREPGLDSGPAQDLTNLARSLQNLDGGLDQFLQARDQQQQQQDQAAAQLAAIKSNGEGYAQAVSEGKIPAQASPGYVSAYKQAQGALAGADLQEKAYAAYDNWGGKTSTDPNAYRTFITNFISQNVSADDPDVLKGLMPHVNQIVSNLQARHIADVHNDVTTGFTNTTVALADKALQTQRDKAAATGTDFDPNAAWGATMAYRDQFLKSGGTADQIDNKIVDMVTSQALQANPDQGKQILSLLDKQVPGTSYTYAQTPYGEQKKVAAGVSLERMARQQLEDTEKLRTQANKLELGQAQSAVLSYLASNPGKPVPDALIAAGSKQGLDPEFRVNVAKWQDTLLKNAGTSDPQDILNLHWNIVNGGGAGAIAEALNEGKLHSASELDTALKLATTTAKAQDVMAPMLKSEPVKQVMKAIEGRTMNYVFDEHGNMIGRPGVSNEGLGLQLSYTRQLQDWIIAHPDATEQDKQNAANEIGAGVLKTILTPSFPAMPAKVGPQAPTAGPANPYLPPQLQQAPAAPTSTPAPSAPVAPQPNAPLPQQQQQPQMQHGGDAPNAWFAALQPQERASIEAYARTTGSDLGSVITRSYQWHQQNFGGGATQAQPPLAPGAASNRSPPVDGPTMMKGLTDAFNGWRETDPNSPRVVYQLQQSFLSALHNQGNPVGNYTVAAIQNNPKAAHILDFISGPESRGNYNAYFGHGDSTYDLSKMSLNQVMQWQAERVGDGSPSSATGRYQFMRSTLATLKAQMHLTGDEKFTPVLQDEMAIQLLKGRGYDEWVAGKMSDTQFANNLSEEWASLPNMHTGQSHYEGDGLNHALVTPGQVQKVLNAAKTMPISDEEPQQAAPASDDSNGSDEQ